MKEKILLLSFLTVLSTLRLHGQEQETVTLSVKSLTDTSKIILSKSKGQHLDSESTLQLASNTWTFAVEPNNLPFTIKIQQNEPVKFVKLPSIARKYAVTNGIFEKDNLSFSGSMNIAVIKPNGESAKEYTNVVFTTPGTTSPDKAGGNPSTATSRNHPVGAVYYDALYLSNPANPKNTKRSILAYYANTGADTTEEELVAALGNNKFLAGLIDKENKKLLFKQVGGLAVQQGAKLAGAFSLSGIGGLDVTNVADGLAKFLVKRTKEELNVAFFQRFKKLIDDRNYIDLQTVFPETFVLLSAIGEDVYDYQRYIQNLRESFKNDLDELNRNLPTIISNHQEFFNARPVLRATLRSGFYVSTALEDQVHPGDILAGYPVDSLDDAVEKRPDGKRPELKNLQGAIQTLQLVSASLRDTVVGPKEDLSYWVGIKQVRELVNNKNAFKIYLGLLYQEAINKYARIPYQNTDLIALLDKVGDDYDNNTNGVYDSYKRYILQFGERADVLNKMIKDYDRPATDSLAIEQYAKYFRTSVDLLAYSLEAIRLPHINTIKLGNGKSLSSLADSLRRYFTIAYSASDLVIETNRRNYSAAINHAVRIYDLVRVKPAREEEQANKKKFDKLSKQEQASLKKYLKNWRRFTNGDETNALKTEQQVKLDSLMKPKQWDTLKPLLASIDSAAKSQQAISIFIKYGSFLASVATAKSSDEVEQAIEAFALPSGSARVKRESSFNVSLNAYTGLFAGWERIQELEPDKKFSVNSFGVTAPVGIAISLGKQRFLGLGKAGAGHWSYSAFISLIDIGTVAAFRFQEPTQEGDPLAAQIPTIQLQDIVSPGLFFSIGIPKTPLSINLGSQVGPNLRKVYVKGGENDTPTNEYANNVYWRHSISLVVDIPILNFHTKTRN